MMFLVIAVGIAVLSAIAELCTFHKTKSAKEIIRVVFRNLFAVSLGEIAVQKYVLRYEHFLDTSQYGVKDYLVFAIASLVFAALFEGVAAFVMRSGRFMKKEEKKSRIAGLMKCLSVLMFFIGAAAYFGTLWGGTQFGFVTGDQLLINLTSPTEGTEMSIYIDGFENGVFPTLLVTAYFSIVVYSDYLFHTKKSRTDSFKRTVCFILAFLVVLGSVLYGSYKFRLDKVLNAYVLKSDMIDANYATPETVKVTFPEKKRNLIHIYLESMENSFMSKDLGGNMDQNLIPNLTKLAQSGIVFSDTDNYFGGPQQGTGTQWSIASMVNQTSGLPMKAPGILNAYGVEGNFLPGAYTLGELLESQGYEQSLMIGASATFGGLRYYYDTHGNWKVMDYDYAKEHKMIPEDYKVWWGYEDDKLYEFAKEEITRLYQTGKPFNFTMENADTHKPDGYVTPGKEKPFDSPYANAVWNSDKDVCAFVKWIQSQPFYENTTVILIGDHLSMDYKFFEVDNSFDGYKRVQYNVILNPAPAVAAVSEDVTKNRLWANWDMFPTIVASLGAEIEGERLGIGTNLFSGKPTLYEEYGVNKVNNEFDKGSDVFTEEILGGKNAFEGTRFRSFKK